MRHWKALGGSAAFVIALSGSAAADVTGMEVWENWLAAGESMGQTITPGSLEQAGDVLTVRDIAFTLDAAEATVRGTLEFVTFTDNADGTVSVAFPPTYAMTVDVDPEMGEAASVAMTVDQAGLSMIASGGGDTVAYDFVAPEISVTVDEVVADGEALDFDIAVILTGAGGRYQVTEGGPTVVDSRVAADLLTAAISLVDPDNAENQIDLALEFADVAGTSSGSMTFFSDMTDIAGLLADGMYSQASLTHGTAAYSLDVTGEDNFSFAGGADEGSLDIALDQDALSYAIGNSGYTVSVSGDEIPLPVIEAAADRIGFGLLLPVSASDVPQDFGLRVALEGFSVSDMIWGMFDPGGVLPRDPATLILDVAGTANWFFDIMDPEVQDEMGDAMPGEIHSLVIEELELSLAGSELTGDGSFTFDNSDLMTFDGLPAPDGSVNLRLVGANTLIDNLVAMGLVPEDQAMGARMMMGLFARPGDGEDTLVSTIEVKPDGSILANGQRLQ